jgi:hypothetical protein
MDNAGCTPGDVREFESALCAANAYDPEGGPLTWQWSASAGTFSVSDNPTIYTANFTISDPLVVVQITVTVTDDHNQSVSRQTSIVVRQQ